MLRKDFVNYWNFFGVSMNESTSNLVILFMQWFDEIESSLDRQEENYNVEDLKKLNMALKTLITPSLRFLHNYEITRERVPFEKFVTILGQLRQETSDSLSFDISLKFQLWLKAKIEDYEASYFVGLHQRVVKWNTSLYQLKFITDGLQEIMESLQNLKGEELDFNSNNKLMKKRGESF